MPKRDRSGDESSPGRVVAPTKARPNHHDVRARRWALTDDDVELVVLECGVEFFFEDRLHAVDFVEEQYLALAQVGEDGCQVALNLQGRPGGLLEAYVELVGDDGGEGGFAQSRWTEEQDVIEGFAADLAASSAIASCSLALDWPMNSPSQRGRSLSSKELSSSPRVAETSRSGSLSLRFTIRSVSIGLHRHLRKFIA